MYSFNYYFTYSRNSIIIIGILTTFLFLLFFSLYNKIFLYYITQSKCLGGGSGRRVGLKIQSGSPLVPVQVRLKANLTLLRECFLLRTLTRSSKLAKAR